jgi:hypothetical protein
MESLVLKPNGDDLVLPKKELLRTVLTPHGAKRSRMDDAPRGEGIIPSTRGKLITDHDAERSAKKRTKETDTGKNAAESRLIIKREVRDRLRKGTPLQKLLTKIGVHFTVVRATA